MLTDAEEENRTRKHRSISKRQKLNRSPSSRKKYRSPPKKRIDLPKLTKEEVKYQRFLNGLKKDIQFYLNKRLLESRFDPSGKQDLQINFCKRTNQTDKLVTVIANKRQHVMKLLKSNETKRLTADVETILTGPALKSFYIQFIQPRDQNSSPRLRPLEESILWSNEQE